MTSAWSATHDGPMAFGGPERTDAVLHTVVGRRARRPRSLPPAMATEMDAVARDALADPASTS